MTAPETLRPYQEDALERLRAEYRRGRKKLVLVAPTGSGKTTISAAMIRSAVAKGHACLFLAHRRELIQQCSDRLHAHGVPHGVVQAGHPLRLPHLPVQIASVQTLVRRIASAKPAADFVVVDECHHFSRGNTYDRIMAAYPDVRMCGLSATPYRGDGRALGDIFDAMIVGAEPLALVHMGYLMAPEIWNFPRPDLDRVKTVRGDYDTAGLENAMDTTILNGDIVKQWGLIAGGARTVVFAVSVRHSGHIAARFQAAGVAAEHLDGETPKTERDAILARLKDGTTRVVSNVGVLTEGYDLPELEVAVLARPTQSLGLYIQMVGRIMRPAPGKSRCTILDHAGCYARHGNPLLSRTFSLEGNEKATCLIRDSSGPRERTCHDCHAVVDRADTFCPKCGVVFDAPDLPAERDVGLQRVDTHDKMPMLNAPRVIERKAPTRPNASLREMTHSWHMLQRIAEQRAYKVGWAARVFRGRYGIWPEEMEATT